MMCMLGCIAGGRVRAAVEASARRQRKVTAKVVYDSKGSYIYPTNPGRNEKLVLTTDCVY